MAAIDRYSPELVVVDSGTESDTRVLESVNRIKERYPTLPIFLIARKSSETLAIGALKAGVDDYFKAPASMLNIFYNADQTGHKCRNIELKIVRKEQNYECNRKNIHLSIREEN